MPKLNLLIASENEQSKTIELIKKSKYLNKLYSTAAINGAIEIKFNTFKELAQKCKALKIDIVIVESEKWVLQGVADVLRANLVNCLALTARANQLILSNSRRQELLNKYGILTPKKLLYPSEYPVIVRADGVCKKGNSLDEIIQIRGDIAKQSEEIAKTVFLEEFIEGKIVNLISIFDGKNLLSFTKDDLILDYSDKLQKLLTCEKFGFIGFLNSELIISGSKIYNLGFSSNFSDISFDIDFIYLLNSAIYQKLNEISITDIIN